MPVDTTDRYTNAQRVIEAEHAMIHDGWHFFVSDVSLAVSISSSVTYIVNTDGAAQHFLFEVDSDGGVAFTITEGVTTSADGTVLTTFNRNRVSSNISSLVVTKTPTGVTGGTQIWTGGSTNKSGGTSRSLYELILKPNTKYAMTLTAYTNNVNIGILFDWYNTGH